MPRADRAEALATLRRLPPAIAADDRWAAAALLHDAGKADGRTSAPFGRALRDGARPPSAIRPRSAGAPARYLRHAEIGAETARGGRARAPKSLRGPTTHHDPAPVAGRGDPRAGLRALAGPTGKRSASRG